jgi:hypothetical protein
VHLAGDDLVWLAIQKKLIPFDDKVGLRFRFLREARGEKKDASVDSYDETLQIVHDNSPFETVDFMLA